MLPLASIAMPSGPLNWPLPEPEEPTTLRNSPFSLNCSRRLLPASATQKLPLAVKAIDLGWANWPLPVPEVPKVFVNSPFSLNSCRRLLFTSATQRLPLASIATSPGWANWPLPVPEVPNEDWYLTPELHSLSQTNCCLVGTPVVSL